MNQLTLKEIFKPYNKVSKILTLLICLYILVSFFEGYLNELVGAYNKYLIILIILGLFLNNKSYRFKWYHISFSFWFLLKVISVSWSRDLTMAQETFTTQASMFLFFFLMSSNSYNRNFIKPIYRTFLFSSALMGILGLFFSRSYLFFETRQVLTIFDVQIDPNYLAAHYLVAIALALSNIFYFKKNRVLSSIIFLINSYTIAITGSRGGIITYILLLVIVVIVYNSEHLLSLSFLYKIFITISMIAIIFFIFATYLPANIYERLFNFEGYGGGSERLQLWQNAFQLYVQYPFFGSGWGAYYGYNGVYQVIHNTFLLILVEGGIIGFLLFFAPLIKAGLVALTHKQLPILLILAAALGPAFFLDALDQRFLWNALILSFVLINGQVIFQKNKSHWLLKKIKSILDNGSYNQLQTRHFISLSELQHLFIRKNNYLMSPLVSLTLAELRHCFTNIDNTSRLADSLLLFELQSCFDYGHYFDSKEKDKLNLNELNSLFELSDDYFISKVNQLKSNNLIHQVDPLSESSKQSYFGLSLFELQSCYGYGHYFDSKTEAKLTLDELNNLLQNNSLNKENGVGK